MSLSRAPHDNLVCLELARCTRNGGDRCADTSWPYQLDQPSYQYRVREPSIRYRVDVRSKSFAISLAHAAHKV